MDSPRFPDNFQKLDRVHPELRRLMQYKVIAAIRMYFLQRVREMTLGSLKITFICLYLPNLQSLRGK